MDSLATLPLPKVPPTYTEEEKAVHRQFFLEETNTEDSSSSDKSTRDLVLYATFLFLLLSNPFVDEYIERIPYCDGVYSRLICKAIIFAILFFAIYTFVC
jgi:hypothetical protein